MNLTRNFVSGKIEVHEDEKMSPRAVRVCGKIIKPEVKNRARQHRGAATFDAPSAIGFREQPETAVLKAERFRAQFDGANEDLRLDIEGSRPLVYTH
jgi:hypothetical protein